MELIPGGLSSGMSPSDFDPIELKRGIAVEMEHTTNQGVAREIAMDHLVEDPLYYQKLSRMEQGDSEKSLSKSFDRYISKGKYWSHVDGTLWWRNPESDQIEPYRGPEDDTQSQQEAPKPLHTSANSLTGIPTQSANAAVYAARSLVLAIRQGTSQEAAIQALTNSARKSAKILSDPKLLNGRIASFNALGFKEAADVFKERLNELSANEVPLYTPSKPALGKNMAILNGEPVKYQVVDRDIGGSTGAYVVYAGDQNYVVKEYSGNESQVKNEYLANNLYKTFNLSKGKGSPAPDSQLAQVGDKKALFSPFIQDVVTLEDAGLEQYPSTVQAEIRNALRENFVIDAWLANWDVIGLTQDNIGISMQDGMTVTTRLDNGGALLFRAQGSPKGDAFGEEVTELDSMRDPNKAESAADIFGDISDTELVSSLNDFDKRMQKIGAQGVYEMVSNSGFSEKASLGLTDLMMARYDSMMDYRDKLVAKKKDLVDRTFKESKEVGHYSSGDAALEAFKATKVSAKAMEIVNAFTEAADETNGMNYAVINEALAVGDTTKEARNLEKVIENLPRVSGVTVRGASSIEDVDYLIDKLSSGKWPVLEWKAFSSSSLNPGQSFDSDGGITFIIQNKGIHGRYIAPLSDSPTEDEVLYKPGSKFRVVGHADTNEQALVYGSQSILMGHTVILEEVTHEEFASIKGPQEPPREWSHAEVLGYLRDNAKPTDPNELVRLQASLRKKS